MRIKKDYAKYLFCMLPFLEMPRWGGITSINNAFLIWKIISTIIVCITMFTEVKFNKLDITLLLYCGTIIFSTIYHKGDMMDAVSDMLALIIPFLLLEIYLGRISLKKLLMPIILVIFSYGIITLFQIIKIPFHILIVQGLRDSYFSILNDEYGSIFALGSLKRFGFMLIPALIFTFLLEYKNQRKTKAKLIIWFTSLLTIFLLIYSWSIASLFTAVAIVIIYWAVESEQLGKCFTYINAKIFFRIFILLNWLLIMTPFLEIFNDFLAVFGKTSTLSGRTYVWENALRYIAQNPLLGCGIDKELTASRFWNLVHMHNLLLNSAYEGGIVALVLILYILFLVSKKLANNSQNPYAKILTIALIGFFILAFADTPEYNMLFLLFPLMYSVDRIKTK